MGWLKRLALAVLNGLATYVILYVAPGLLIDSMTSVVGAGVSEGLLESLRVVEDVGWGFVALAVALPLVKGTPVAGLAGLLTNSYVAYLAYKYLHPGLYSTTVEVPATSNPGLPPISVHLELQFQLIYYLLIASLVVGAARGLVRVVEDVRSNWARRSG